MYAGCQHPEHERRTGRTDVQELPVERALPPRGYVSLYLTVWLLASRLTAAATENLKDPS